MKIYIFQWLLLWLMASEQTYAQLDITWPANRTVFQRASINCNETSKRCEKVVSANPQ